MGGVLVSEWSLTATETMVMDLVVQGVARKQIGEELGMSGHTVKFHVGNIFKKMRVRSIVTAALMYDRQKRAA